MTPVITHTYLSNLHLMDAGWNPEPGSPLHIRKMAMLFGGDRKMHLRGYRCPTTSEGREGVEERMIDHAVFVHLHRRNRCHYCDKASRRGNTAPFHG